MRQKQEQYVERFARFIEKNGGLPRIAGKIFSYLLICEPPVKSSTEIIRELRIAKSSFSSMIKLLLNAQLVEEIVKPNKRVTFYKIKEKGWEDMLLRQLECMTAIRSYFAEGRSLLKNIKSRKRINDLDKLYAFLEKEMPALIKKWKRV